MSLTPDQVARFREAGVVRVDGLFTPEDLAPLQAEIEAWIDRRARELREQGHLSDLCEGEPFERRYASLYAQSGLIGTALDVAFLRGAALFAFLRHPRLLDAVESLIGPEITLNPIHHLRPKLPQPLVHEIVDSYYNVPWHQDSGVMWEEADPVPVISVWIPLVDADEENGCMQVMPGVARGGHLPHQAAGGTTLVPEAIPDVPPEVLPCPRGGAIFQDKFTPHRSTPNRTDGVRWSLDVRYQPSDAPTGRPFHPAFVVRSRATPEREVRDPAVWDRGWRDCFAALAGKPEPQAHRVVR